MRIAIIGGTGPLGRGLGLRWAAAGHEVVIGSREAEKGEQVAAELREMQPGALIYGADNVSALDGADVALLSVPYEAQEATLAEVREALAGKILMTAVSPVRSPKGRVWRLESGLSAAEEAQRQLGEETHVVAAFQTIGARHLTDLNYQLDSDVLVCGDKAIHKAVALQLCQDAGMSGVNAGALQNASAVEGLTSIMIFVNVHNKVSDAGLRITGI